MLHLALLLAVGATDEIVARIDGVPIAASEIGARVAASAGTSPAAVLQDLLNDTALAGEAERLGYPKDARVLKDVEQERRRLAGERFLAKALSGVGKLDDVALRELFHEQADAVKIRTIVVATEAQAAAIKARLAKGADFAAEAAASLDANGRSGAAQWRLRAQVEQELRGAFTAPLQEVVGPVTLKLGTALFQVVERTIGSEREFAERREALARFAQEQARAQMKSHVIAQLRKETGAEIDEAFIRSTDKRLGATAEEEAHAVARIRGKPVTYGEVLPEIQKLARGKEGGHFSGTRVKTEVAYQVVGIRVLEEEGMRAGMGAGREIDAALVPVRRDAMLRAYAADLRARAPKATPADVESYYQANAARFQRPGTRTCSHLLAHSRDLAEVALKRIRGGQPFEQVARDLSADSSTAAAGGALGALSDDQLGQMARDEPDLAAAVRDSKAGAVTAPVKSRAGWHLLLCGAYRPPGPAPLAEVSATIAQQVERARGDDAIRARFAELRAKAKVSIDEAALQRATSGK